MKRAWIHILYWITFLVIPILVIYRELRDAYYGLEIFSDIKMETYHQWYRYKKFISMKDKK